MTKHLLETAAQGIADATSQPPFLYQLGPDGARKVLDDIQAAPIEMPPIDEKWITVPADVGDVRVRIVKPVGADGPMPTVLYVHGGGWILGNAGTHDRLVRELAVGAEAFLIVDENDVLRDEGEAYARKLIEAGVRTTSVRYNGTIHDFMMLNPVRETAATTGAMEQAIHVLRKALSSK